MDPCPSLGTSRPEMCGVVTLESGRGENTESREFTFDPSYSRDWSAQTSLLVHVYSVHHLPPRVIRSR